MSVLYFFFSTEPSRVLGSIINVFILALGVWACIEIARARQRLSAEMKILDGAKTSAASSAEALVSSVSGVHASTILGRRIHLLHDLQQASAEIDSSTLSALTLSELDDDLSRARWVSSTVVMFGLGGTLVGLSLAVAKAQPLLATIIEKDSAVQAIIETFDGLGTAFSTTLTGIVMSVILGRLIGTHRGMQTRFLRELEQFTAVKLLPRFRISPNQALLQAASSLASLEAKLATSFDSMNDQLRTQGYAMTKVIESSLSAVVNQARDTGDGLRRSVDLRLTEVTDAMQSRGLALTETVDRSFLALMTDTREAHTQVLSRMIDMQETLARFVGSNSSESATLGDILGSLHNGVRALERASEQMLTLTPALEEVLSRQADQQTRDIHKSLTEYTSRLVAQTERSGQLIDDGFKRLDTRTGEFASEMLRQQQQREAQMLGSIQTAVEGIAAVLRAGEAQLSALGTAVTALQASAGAIGSRAGAESALAAQLTSAAKEMRSAISDLSDRTSHRGNGDSQRLASAWTAAPASAPEPRALDVPRQPRVESQEAPQPSGSTAPIIAVGASAAPPEVSQISYRGEAPREFDNAQEASAQQLPPVRIISRPVLNIVEPAPSMLGRIKRMIGWK